MSDSVSWLLCMVGVFWAIAAIVGLCVLAFSEYKTEPRLLIFAGCALLPITIGVAILAAVYLALVRLPQGIEWLGTIGHRESDDA